MYSWEIKNFIKERNFYIQGEDLLKLISIEENPQLSHILFHPENSSYEMWDKEGNYFVFIAAPYEEEKTFVKVRRR